MLQSPEALHTHNLDNTGTDTIQSTYNMHPWRCTTDANDMHHPQTQAPSPATLHHHWAHQVWTSTAVPQQELVHAPPAAMHHLLCCAATTFSCMQFMMAHPPSYAILLSTQGSSTRLQVWVVRCLMCRQCCPLLVLLKGDALLLLGGALVDGLACRQDTAARARMQMQSAKRSASAVDSQDATWIWSCFDMH
jgi:hypothetical protein